jgi:starch phosphorylase
MTSRPATIAYFSMEIGLDDELPTYAGGLGVLAGDTIRAAADLDLPLVAVTLLHRQGYLRQTLDAERGQSDAPTEWPVDRVLRLEPARCSVTIEGREVVLRAWRRDVGGATGGVVSVYFLDADHDGNDPADRALTGRLYGGDQRYRLAQEIILGAGGVRMLHALGHDRVACHHMNEGHAALLVAELLAAHARANGGAIDEAARAAVRATCVFTTHTPVPAGHDRFPLALVESVAGRGLMDAALAAAARDDGHLDMTRLALASSRYVNAVAKRHGEVTRKMFPGQTVDAITNGVHAPTWTAPAMAALFDDHLPGWRGDATFLREAVTIPPAAIAQAHGVAKGALVDLVNGSGAASAPFDATALTIGFARRATPYKRATLVLRDPARLRAIATALGGLQIVFAGKAHPADEPGKEVIRAILCAREESRAAPAPLRIAYLPGYDMDLARRLVAGADVWLNTPRPPLEASGTSGMKAAINGVPSLSVLDGWWVEGWIEGVTGWAIGGERDHDRGASDDELDSAHAESLYEKLERSVGPAFREGDAAFARQRRYAIALNGSFFHTHRMVRQYVDRAYGIAEHNLP